MTLRMWSEIGCAPLVAGSSEKTLNTGTSDVTNNFVYKTTQSIKLKVGYE